MKDFSRRVITLRRIIKTGGYNFIRNAWLSVAAVAVMVITLTIVLFSVIANATFANTVKQLTDRIDISVYLKDDITQPQRSGLIKQFENLENVRDVEYVSKEQALKDFQKQNQNSNTGLGAAVTQIDNPLPASLRIKPKDPNRIQEVKDFIEQPEIKNFQSAPTSYSADRKAAIDKITQATRFFRQAGVAGVFVFAVISMLIIFNTIRMAIFNRRDELTIMRLLGASTWFIRGPFIVETVFYGVAAAAVAVFICNILFAISSSAFGASSLGLLDLQFANDYFATHFWLILTLVMAIGIVIGAASSYIATRRYLKFKSSK